MTSPDDKLREECAAWWCEWIQEEDDIGPTWVEREVPELLALATFARQQRAAALREMADAARLRWVDGASIAHWLRARADELEMER